MDDSHKTKTHLILELEELRRRVAEIDKAKTPSHNAGPPFRDWAETAASAIFVFEDSAFLYTNPAMTRLTGYTEEELFAKDIWSLIHPEFRELIRDRVAAWRRGEAVPARSEFKILTKSGEARWINADSTFVKFEGRPAALTIAFDSTDHKVAEESLNESEARYRSVVETAQEGVWIVDEEARTTYVNHHLAEMFGYTKDEMIGRSVFSFVSKSAREEARSLLESGRAGLKWRNDFRFLRKDGSDLWTIVSTTPLLDGGGRFVGGLAMLVDVTKRHSAEDALRASEARYRDLVENARDIIYSHDLKGNYTSVNKAVEHVTGYTREEALKLNLGQTVAPEYIETARSMIAAKLDGQEETVYDLEIIAKDGRRITVEVNTRLVHEGDVPVGIQGIARDVTERKLAEEALRESQSQLQAILDYCPAMIFQKDLEGRYLKINRQFERTLNLSPEQVLGRTDEELFPPGLAAAFRAADRSVLQGGSALEFEDSALHADGLHTYIVHKFPLLDVAGNVYAVGGISTEITARKRAEDDLRKQKEILQRIFDHIPVMIRFLDEDGRVKLINQEWERTLGWSLEEIERRGVDIFAELYPDPGYRRYVKDLVLASTGEFTELRTRTRDGRCIDTSFANIRLDDGTNIGIGRDITEQKHAADLLRRQAAQLAALHEIELEISAESDLSRILEVVTHRAAELLDATHCNTFIRQSDEPALTLVAALESRFIGLRLEGDEGLAGRVLITGESQGVDDYSAWQGRVRSFDTEDFGPTIAAPLKWHQTVIGVIGLARKRGAALFTLEDSRLLEQLAAEAAIAIHQATLFDEVQENRNRLQILSRRLIDAQEAERKRLSRELHDQIGQALTAVQISLQSLQTSSAREAARALTDCLAIIDDALLQVHDLSLDLRPSLLDDLGLEAALRWYVDRVASRAGLIHEFKADLVEARLGPQMETTCFRIAQEALTNVLRHARASTICVQVTQRISGLLLVVRDDGVGFDVRDAMSRTGVNASLGLQGMRERAVALGGIVDIKSRPGRGSEVQVSFPLTSSYSAS